ncbi:conjugal transfer protein TraN [Rubrimonas cliftonensis]|uniref:Type-1V conjugative transfer system mating pair stabilisation n=1 Tax=Rubrimonas cliftonensis TaxID=89524 RepID=A0A1H4EPL1_9RHOB|nr:conjugal transfer protein TraN [Rubrimonas cliftonensis]SEA86789.1 Type-1V conjugative transfer system mating pair stabilisation [Rubrimonas cliftonensis]
MTRAAAIPALARAARCGVTVVAAAAHLAVLTAPAFADPMQDRAAEGQGFANTLIVDPATLARLNTDGTAVSLYPDAASPRVVDLADLFPASGGPTVVDPRAFYGDDEAARTAGVAAAGALEGATTPPGAAWRTAAGSRDRAGVDLRDDPVLDQTKALVGSLDALATEFTACAPVDSFKPRDIVNRVTTERTCLRVSAPSGVVEMLHDLDMSVDMQALSFATPQRVDRVEVDFLAGERRIFWSTSVTEEVCEYRESGSETGVGSEVCEDVTTVTPRVSVAPAPAWDFDAFCGPDADRVATVAREYFEATGVTRTLGPGDRPDCANGLTYSATLTGAACWTQTRFVGGDDGEWVTETVCPSGAVDLDLAITIIEADAWRLTSTVDGVLALQASGCSPALTTVAGGALTSARCLNLGGGEICPGDLAFDLIRPPPFDPGETVVSRLAMRVQADLATCTPVVSPTETCAPLVADPACTYRTTWPVGGAGGMHEDVYDCETARTVRTAAATGALSCPPVVRGLEGDLVTPVYETNTSFHEVAAELAALQFTSMDTACGDESDASVDPLECTVFEGERRTCKVAAFGVVDCCESPGGISLAQYLQLAFAMGELEGAVSALDPNTALSGAWEVVTGPFDAAYDVVLEGFGSAWNSVTGSELAFIDDLVRDGVIGTLKQQLMNQTAQWIATTFGDAAANALFVSATSTAGSVVPASTGGVVAGNVALAPALATAASVLSVVMIAYAIYQVAVLIATIVWACSDQELETAVKRELKSCRYNGQYCASSFFGVCLERRRSYCCFASPLSRIMQEQIRLQTGAGWGTARNPQCGGMSVADLQAIDFATLDLGEWMDILLDTGVMPDGADATIAAMTGAGRSLADAAPADMPRLDVVDRTLSRTGGVAVGDIEDAAQRQIRGELE